MDCRWLEVSGCQGIIAACLVGVSQVMPDDEITVLSFIRFRAKVCSCPVEPSLGSQTYVVLSKAYLCRTCPSCTWCLSVQEPSSWDRACRSSHQ